MLQVFRDSRPFEQAMDSTVIYGNRMRGVALCNDPKDETTISFFNDLERRNPAGELMDGGKTAIAAAGGGPRCGQLSFVRGLGKGGFGAGRPRAASAHERKTRPANTTTRPTLPRPLHPGPTLNRVGCSIREMRVARSASNGPSGGRPGIPFPPAD